MNAISMPTSADYRLPLHRRRKVVNVIALALSLAAMAFGLFWLIWILWRHTAGWACGGLSASIFTAGRRRRRNADGGGLRNAIVGSVVHGARWPRPSERRSESWRASTWRSTASGAGSAMSHDSSTTSCCPHRRS